MWKFKQRGLAPSASHRSAPEIGHRYMQERARETCNERIKECDTVTS